MTFSIAVIDLFACLSKEEVHPIGKTQRNNLFGLEVPFIALFLMLLGGCSEESSQQIELVPTAASTAPTFTMNVGAEFRDCPNCPQMIVVPAGSFIMGSPPGEPNREQTEGPQRRVSIGRPFAIGIYEITFQQWDMCVSDGECRHISDRGYGRGDWPVIDIVWSDLAPFLRWLSDRSGHQYRLLSEAEWEYAARAGTQSTWHFGNIESDLCSYANVGDEYALQSYVETGGTFTFLYAVRCNDGYYHTAIVGSYRPNAFGLYDTIGNAAEFVADCYNENLDGIPSDGSPWLVGRCEHPVTRRGSWNDGMSSTIRLSFRNFGFRDEERARGGNQGFRVARDLDQ